MKWVVSAFFIVLVVRILRTLSERNTLTTVLGSVYLRSEFKTSLYRSLQPLLFVFIFLVKDQEVGNTIYQMELQVFTVVVLTPGIKMAKDRRGDFQYVLLFCLLLYAFVFLNLFVPVFPTCKWEWRFLLNVLVPQWDSKNRQVRAGYYWLAACWRP